MSSQANGDQKPTTDPSLSFPMVALSFSGSRITPGTRAMSERTDLLIKAKIHSNTRGAVVLTRPQGPHRRREVVAYTPPLPKPSRPRPRTHSSFKPDTRRNHGSRTQRLQRSKKLARRRRRPHRTQSLCGTAQNVLHEKIALNGFMTCWWRTQAGSPRMFGIWPNSKSEGLSVKDHTW